MAHLRLYGAPLLLVGVALVQRYLIHNACLDPWKGGGFGMFSATSSRNLRQLTVTLVSADGMESRFPPSAIANRIPLGGDIRWYRHRLLTMPYPALLQELADQLARSEWVCVVQSNEDDDVLEAAGGEKSSASGADANDPSESSSASHGPTPTVYYRMKEDAPEDAIINPASLSEIRVEIWQYDVGCNSNELRLTKLTSATAKP